MRVADIGREPVVRLVAARLGEHRHVGRNAAAIRELRHLHIGEGLRKRIGRAAGALEHLAVVVGAVRHLELGGERLDLAFGEFGAARIGEVAEMHVLHGMAVRADLAVDLVAALKLRRIVDAEGASEAPGLALGDLRHEGRAFVLRESREARRAAQEPRRRPAASEAVSSFPFPFLRGRRKFAIALIPSARAPRERRPASRSRCRRARIR